MFLKTESFEHNGVTVTLSELSALQRIEHLALMKRQAEQAESDSNRKFTVEDAIRTGAFVVAMSLWHNHPKKTQMPSMNEAVKQIEQEVLTTWPTEAISHAENVVYRLSGMYEFGVRWGDPTGAPCLPGCHPRSMPTGTAFTVPIIFMMFCWICTFPG
ncbi:tail component of prophage [Shigella sonnei]|nr:tail component of prophage [Shigella sonnei]